MEREEIYKLFVDTFGEDIQYTFAIEEMSELIYAITKYKRKLATGTKEEVAKCKNNVIEEIADVLNTAESLRFMFGKKEVEKIREEKLKRGIKRCKQKNLDVK